MNILFVTHEKAYGGASKALVSLIDQLSKKKYNISVVVPFKNSLIVKELKIRKVNIIYSFYGWWEVPVNINIIKKIIFRLLYLLNFISFYFLVKRVSKLNIDIVHSNVSVINIGAKLADKIGAKHVWHFREFTGVHLKFLLKDKKAYNYINNHSDKIIYVSKSIEKYYKQFINNNIGVVIYDGVDENYLQKKSVNVGSEIKFLVVGTLEKNKGQYLAIEAANILVKQGINNFKILFAGGDPTGYGEELKRLIDKHKIKKNIEFLGFVSDMKKLRKECDVELMCSPAEAFGLVTIEAMMSNNPVIGSNSGATPELIVDKKNGLLFKKEDYIDLALKMELLISDSKLIKKMGNYAYNYAKDKFSSKTNALNIETVYEELCGDDNNDLFKNKR